MKKIKGIVATLACGLLAGVSHASVVSTIDPAGGKDVDVELRSASMATIQTLITARNDLTAAGVLDGENTSSNGGFNVDPDYAGLDITISGGTRYGRAQDGTNQQATSGTHIGYISGTETWTFGGTGISHLGLTHYNLDNFGSDFAVTATYSDNSEETVSITEATAAQATTYFIGFTKPGETITKITIVEPSSHGAFAAYDDVAFVTVPEPGAIGLCGLGGLLMLRRRGQRTKP